MAAMKKQEKQQIILSITPVEGKEQKVTTPFDGFALTPQGIQYTDKKLNFTKIMCWDKVKSFKVTAVIAKHTQEMSKHLQNFYSDENPRAKKRSANWTI